MESQNIWQKGKQDFNMCILSNLHVTNLKRKQSFTLPLENLHKVCHQQSEVELFHFYKICTGNRFLMFPFKVEYYTQSLKVFRRVGMCCQQSALRYFRHWNCFFKNLFPYLIFFLLVILSTYSIYPEVSLFYPIATDMNPEVFQSISNKRHVFLSGAGG